MLPAAGVPVAVSGISEPPQASDALAGILKLEIERGGPPLAIQRLAIPAPDKPGDAEYLVVVTDDAARSEVLRLTLRPASGDISARYEYVGTPVPITGDPLLLAAPVDTAWARLAVQRKLSRALELRLVDASGAEVKVDVETAKRPRGFDPERQANDPPDSVRARAPGLQGAGHRLVLPSGAWILDQDLVVPRGTTLVVEPGTTLLLAPARSVFAYGRLELLGTAERPVTLAPLGRGPWGVVALLGGGSKGSVFEHVRFIRGSSGAAGALDLNGTLSLVDSAATFAHCRFERSRGEDTIHVERSEITVSDSVFASPSSDGVDLVMAKATVRRSWFEMVGDDAIDAGHTTELTVHDCVVRGAAGKAISVGQGSTGTISGTFLLEAERGVSVFDGSKVAITSSAIAYSKRAAIQTAGGAAGPGVATIDRSLLWENGGKWGQEDRITVSNSRTDARVSLEGFRALEGVGPLAVPLRPAEPAAFLAPEGGKALLTGTTVEASVSRPMAVSTWVTILAGLLAAGCLLLVLERMLRSRR